MCHPYCLLQDSIHQWLTTFYAIIADILQTLSFMPHADNLQTLSFMPHVLYIYNGKGRLKHNISKRIIQKGRHFTVSKTLTVCEAYMVVIGSSNGLKDWCSRDSFISISRQCIIWMKMALHGKTFSMFPHLSEESIGLWWIIMKKYLFCYLRQVWINCWTHILVISVAMMFM